MTIEELYERALEQIMDLYHERHWLTPEERKMLPFQMKEKALIALFEANRLKEKAS